MTAGGTIGKRIRSLRMERGWSQDKLARRASVTKTTVGYWETGQTIHLQRGTLKRVAAALGVTPEFLEMGYDPQNSSPVELTLRHGTNLTSEEIEQVMSYIRVIQEKHHLERQIQSPSQKREVPSNAFVFGQRE